MSKIEVVLFLYLFMVLNRNKYSRQILRDLKDLCSSTIPVCDSDLKFISKVFGRSMSYNPDTCACVGDFTKFLTRVKKICDC